MKTKTEKMNHDSRRWLKHKPPRRSDRYKHLPPRKVWGPVVDKALADYPALWREYQALHSAPSYRMGRTGISPERELLRELPHQKQRVYDAVRAAVHLANRTEPEGKARARLLRRELALQLYREGMMPHG